MERNCSGHSVQEVAGALVSGHAQSIKPKRNQSSVFTGRTDAEAKTSILWPPDVKHELTRIKTLILGKIEVKRIREQQRMRCLDSITDSVDTNLSKLREIVEDRGAWHAVVHLVSKSWRRLSD